MLKIILLLIFCFQTVLAQGSAGSDSKIEPRYLVDLPTAGMLKQGSLAFDLDCYQAGGLLAGVSYSLIDRLSAGISFGGTNLLGTDKPVWNKLPGFFVKGRIADESKYIPAIALGFDNQGKETYLSELDRYSVKSPGFYLVMSKNYKMLGYLSVHGGFNYSLERSDGDKDMNYFIGVEKTVGPSASLVAEYNLGLNDNKVDSLIRSNGYLNAGFRISLGGGFTIGLNMKDILRNKQHVTVGSRTLKMEFIKPS